MAVLRVLLFVLFAAACGSDPPEGSADGGAIRRDDGGSDRDGGRDAGPPPMRLEGEPSTAECYSSPPAEDVSNLFDGDSESKFVAFGVMAWAAIDTGEPHVVRSYALTSANDAPERDPVRFVLLGSHDGLAYVELDRQVAQTFAERFERREISFENDVAYRYYQLQLESSSGGVVQLAEWELVGVPPAATGAEAPAAPAGLAVSGATPTTIELAWTDASSDEDRFVVESSEDGVDWAEVATLPRDTTGATVRGLAPGAHLSLRVTAVNAAGASSPAAIEADSAAIAERTTPRGLEYAYDGYTFTVNNMGDLVPDATVDALAIEFFETYPGMAARFNPTTVRYVFVVIDPELDGLAFAGGDTISINSNWLLDHPLDIDVIVHEGFHLVQHYTRGETPGWAVEGLADYARFEHGRLNRLGCWALQRYEPSQSYTDAYGVTARFFLWLELRDPIMVDLDAELRAGTYTDAFWEEATGMTIDELWAAYAADDARAPAVYR
jgi:hypothetical protein